MDRSMLKLEDDQPRQEDEEEETISLSEFQINSNKPGSDESRNLHDRRSSSEFFEFFSDLTYEMSHADDIIFCGKLVPLRDDREHPISTVRKQSLLYHRRCESLSESAGSTRTNSTKSGRGHVRSSRSLDSGKLHRNPPGLAKAADSCPPPRLRIQKPRWYVLMFGHVKLPPEMELRDIKNRQVRQNHQLSTTIFSSPSSCSTTTSLRRNNRRTSWDLLKVLSCKDHASVAATTSFRVMSQASSTIRIK